MFGKSECSVPCFRVGHAIPIESCRGSAVSSPSTPANTPRPFASSLNYVPGAAAPNELVAKLSATGTICLYTLAAVDLVVDVTGVIS